MGPTPPPLAKSSWNNNLSKSESVAKEFYKIVSGVMESKVRSKAQETGNCWNRNDYAK